MVKKEEKDKKKLERDKEIIDRKKKETKIRQEIKENYKRIW